MISSTVLTLVVIPAVYSVWREYQMRHAAQDLIDSGTKKVALAAILMPGFILRQPPDGRNATEA